MTPRVDPIRVAIAGGHQAVRGAVRLACGQSADLDLVEETGDPSLAGEVCARAHPDVVVIHVDGPNDDLMGLRDLRTRGLDTTVVLLADRVDGSTVLAALKLGVRGCLGTADGLRSVGDVIRRVAAGERVVAPDLEQAAVMALGHFARRTREGSEVEASLTPRELEILSMISEGYTMQQVGTRLGISPRTVETHVAKLYRKLGVRTRVQAVSRAAQLGLLDLGQ